VILELERISDSAAGRGANAMTLETPCGVASPARWQKRPAQEGRAADKRSTSEGGRVGGKHDIPQLERNMKSLHEAVRVLAVDDDYLELLKIIHFPGYTTPAEFQLVNAVVKVMQVQVHELTGLKQTLLSASREIIEEHERVEAMA
jgi:hypothetical protein